MRTLALASRCADAVSHTPNQPTGYRAWSAWADRMAQTHTQTQCPTCGLWVIWVPREAASA